MVRQGRNETCLPPIHNTAKTGVSNSKGFSFLSQTPTKHSFKQFKNGRKPRGSHDYHNLMFEPHVYRGPAFKDFRAENDPNLAGIINFNNFCTDVCRKKEPRRKLILPNKTLGGILRPSTADVVKSKTHKEFGSHAELANFIVEQAEEVDSKFGHSQTDDTDIQAHFQRLRDSLYCKTKQGKDAQTEVYYAELVPYKQEAEPVVKITSSKILEQSILEFMEEEELQEMTKQQINHEAGIRTQVLRYIRLEEREKKYQMEMTVLRNRRAKDLVKEQYVEHVVGSRLFSRAFFRGFPHATMTSMRNAGSLPSVDTAVDLSFLPWLNESTRKEMIESSVSTQIVDDMLKTVSLERQTGVSYDDERKKLANLSKSISFKGTSEVYFKNSGTWDWDSSSPSVSDGEEDNNESGGE